VTARRGLLVWLLLVLLLGVEVLASRSAVTARLVPVIGVAMAALVAMTFMRLGRTRGLAAIFALAGVFWLAVMLGLGGLDPVTRHDKPGEGLCPLDPRQRLGPLEPMDGFQGPQPLAGPGQSPGLILGTSSGVDHRCGAWTNGP
jgi:cytochrome c oxidase subunit 4